MTRERNSANAGLSVWDMFAVSMLLIALLMSCSSPAVPTTQPRITDPTPNPLNLSALSGATTYGEITFQNVGNAPLTFEVSDNQDWLSVSPSSGSVAAGSSQSLAVSASCPSAAGDYSAVVTITSNDPDPVRASREVAVNLSCSVAPPPSPEFVCQDSNSNLTCTLEEAGITVFVPWQGKQVAVRSLPVEDQGVRAAADEFTLLRSIHHFELIEKESGELLSSFDPPITVTVAYTGGDFDSANPVVGQGELGVGVWSEAQGQWITLGQGVFSQGFWIADPIGAAGFELRGQPRYKMTGTTHSGSAEASIAESTGSFLLAWGSLPWDPARAIVPFDTECEQVASEDLTCTSTAAGVTVSLPNQYSGIRMQILAMPLNKGETLTPTMVDGEEVVPTRLLMNFVVVDADNPTTVLDEFSPSLNFDILYTTEDRTMAATSGKLRLAYWHEEIEEIVVLGQGNADACLGSPGCTWGEPVEAEEMIYVENETATGGNAFGTFSKWGDRIILYGQ